MTWWSSVQLLCCTFVDTVYKNVNIAQRMCFVSQFYGCGTRVRKAWRNFQNLGELFLWMPALAQTRRFMVTGQMPQETRVVMRRSLRSGHKWTLVSDSRGMRHTLYLGFLLFYRLHERWPFSFPHWIWTTHNLQRIQHYLQNTARPIAYGSL